MTDTVPFWESKSLQQMTDAEWESLCDGCGRCCLHKLEDSETGAIHFTRIACKLLDLETSQCSDYPNRFEQVPDCLSIKQDLYQTVQWLPSSCAYRLLAEGKTLPDWHPLITGKRQSTVDAGISIRHFAINENDVDGDLQKYLIADL